MMKIFNRTGIVVASVMVLSGVAVFAPSISEAQVKKSGSKYQMRMQWKKSAKLGYNIEVKQVGGSSAPMKMGMDYLVKDTKGTSGTVEVTVRGAGQTPQKETVTIDDRGRVTGGNASGFGNILEFPAEAIAVGGSWKTKANLPDMGGGTMAGTATNTLKGFRTEGGKQYAHVYTELTTTGGGLSGSGKTNTLVSMSDGHILRSTMAMTMSITLKDSQGKPMKQSFDMSVVMTRK